MFYFETLLISFAGLFPSSYPNGLCFSGRALCSFVHIYLCPSASGAASPHLAYCGPVVSGHLDALACLRQLPRPPEVLFSSPRTKDINAYGTCVAATLFGMLWSGEPILCRHTVWWEPWDTQSFAASALFAVQQGEITHLFLNVQASRY